MIFMNRPGTIILLITFGITGVLGLISCEGLKDPYAYGEVFTFEENMAYGKQYYQKKMFGKAVGHFQKARKKRPENFDATMYLANSYYYLGKRKMAQNVESKKKTKKSFRYLDRTFVLTNIASRIKPQNPRPYLLKGRMYFDFHPNKKTFLNKSQKALQNALGRIEEGKQSQVRAQCHYYLGGIAMFQQKFQKGKQHFEKYLSIYDSLGQVPPKEKEVENFIIEYEKQMSGQ